MKQPSLTQTHSMILLLALAVSSSVSRRAALIGGGSSTIVALDNEEDVVVAGTLSLSSEDEPPPDTAKGAVYVTVKLGASTDSTMSLVRAAPLAAVAAIRLTDVTFPVSFRVTSADLFPDAPRVPPGASLTVSARYDADGIAATRDPDDLVASAFTKQNDQQLALKLQPRGLVSKFMKKST